ncbi:MAG: DNA repair helicase XPB [Spirochaetia bacterium]
MVNPHSDIGPLIVQGDNSILLDVHNPNAEAARSDLGLFAELEKSPEHMHTYRITPLSLWNAASAGYTAKDITDRIRRWSRFSVPDNVDYFIGDTISRFGKLVLKQSADPNTLELHISDPLIQAELQEYNRLKNYLTPSEHGFLIDLVNRGTIKSELIKLSYPVKDEAPLKDGAPLEINLLSHTRDGYDFTVRGYQDEAARAFYGNGQPGSGFGTIVLPCGSGKTIVGLKAMALAATYTLILAPNTAAVHQWIDEIIDKTDMSRDQIGEYTGDKKEIRPVTVGTYQILTWRPDKEGAFPHFNIFRNHPWGLIVYDEVHLLPAPVFRVTAEIQAIRRLGLTATLVREDGREDEVFSLVGPKKYDVPWKELESKGWIAEAICHEIRVALPQKSAVPYATADKRSKYRIAAENPVKDEITLQLVQNHHEDHILVIGQYIKQLTKVAEALGAPLITGKTPNRKREEIYDAFRRGEERVIVVSKVANFAIDLPDASVAIQISGTFGSRQEEAQRLGRILRPKNTNSYFYTIVTQHTVEEQFAMNRQKFLTEQGYKYHIDFWSD